MAEKDKDFDRIYRLIKIIEFYELLVEYLLASNFDSHIDKTMDEMVTVVANHRLNFYGGNKSKAAKSLDIARTTMWRYEKAGIGNLVEFEEV